MKITAQEEYGLRCLLQLARHTGPEPLTVSSIAEQEGLSVPYVGKLMAALRQAGLVESVRGRGGGYALTRPSDRITVIQALQGLGGHFFATGFCEAHNGSSDECVHLGDCSIRSLWGVLGRLVDRVLGQTTLADLAKAARPCDSLRLIGQQLAGLSDEVGTESAVPSPAAPSRGLVPLTAAPRKTP
jgi:Rrf2 family transcriptional regulator, iron-sulfur cluster assembly transcription factor